MARALCIAILIALLSGSAEAKGPFGSISIGGWSGGAFTDDRTGRFNACLASARYKSGITFGVRVSSELQWQLAFIHDGWNLTPGTSFPIALTFDGSSPVHVNGKIPARNLVFVDMPDTSLLISLFRKSKVMSAYAQGRVFHFNLDNTSILLPSLVNCVVATKRNGIANAGNFVVQRQAIPQPAAPNVRPEPTSIAKPELQIEAIELATNFILRMGLQNARVTSRSETPVSLVSNGAAWQSDEANGFVRIIPAAENVTGLDVAAAVVAGDAKNCKAKFASGRTTELVDTAVVFRGTSSCEDSDGLRTSNYFIVSRKNGGFILFSVVAGQKAGVGFNEAKSSEARLSDFRKAALVVSGN